MDDDIRRYLHDFVDGDTTTPSNDAVAPEKPKDIGKINGSVDDKSTAVASEDKPEEPAKESEQPDKPAPKEEIATS